MKQKGDVIKRVCFISLVLFSILGLTVFVGCGSGGGGGDGGGKGGPAPGAPTSFTTTSLFPLTSSWQTDNWTLFVDRGEHEFNGVPTKIMADTRAPKLLYWTNDQNGLRLHGFMDEDGVKVEFSPALLVAKPICQIGDIHLGTITAGPDQYNFYIECLRVEDVTVPAGTFENCMKIRMKLYLSTDRPEDYGYETVWLADNVGFVRAEADDTNFSEIFVDAGDTRELLSYHITDVDGLSEDEQDLREFGALFQKYYMGEELNSLMALISDDIKYKCVNKDAIRNNLEGVFNNFSDILPIWSTEDIQFNGDEATTFREALMIRRNDNNNGAIEWIWNRESRVYRKEIDGWKWYGDHLDFVPDYVGVYLRNTAEGGVYNPLEASFFECGTTNYIPTKDVIKSLTVTGPPGSGIDELDLKLDWEADSSWRGFWNTDSLKDPVSGFYTFRVEEPDGDYFMITDYMEATHRLAIAANVVPADGVQGIIPGNRTLQWDPVDLAHAYRVDIRYSTDFGTTWNGMPNQNTTDTHVTVNLMPITEYIWRVRARRFDVFGELDSESRSEYTWFQTAP